MASEFLQKPKSSGRVMMALMRRTKHEGSRDRRQQSDPVPPKAAQLAAAFPGHAEKRDQQRRDGVDAAVGGVEEGDGAEQRSAASQKTGSEPLLLNGVPAAQKQGKEEDREANAQIRRRPEDREQEQQEEAFPRRLFREQQPKRQPTAEKGAPQWQHVPGRINGAHGEAHPARGCARQPLEEWAVGEGDIASEPHAARGFEAGVEQP